MEQEPVQSVSAAFLSSRIHDGSRGCHLHDPCEAMGCCIWKAKHHCSPHPFNIQGLHPQPERSFTNWRLCQTSRPLPEVWTKQRVSCIYMVVGKGVRVFLTLGIISTPLLLHPGEWHLCWMPHRNSMRRSSRGSRVSVLRGWGLSGTKSCMPVLLILGLESLFLKNLHKLSMSIMSSFKGLFTDIEILLIVEPNWALLKVQLHPGEKDRFHAHIFLIVSVSLLILYSREFISRMSLSDWQTTWN